MLDHERKDIFWKCHQGIAGSHVIGKVHVRFCKLVGVWWPTVFKDAKEHARACDVCQRVGQPSRRDELPSKSIIAIK